MSQNIHWTYCQTFSDQILAEGALALQSQPLMRPEQVTSSRPGNYLISCNGKSPFYVGEAKNLTRRIKQQFKATTSTFHKTVLKAPSSCHLSIDSFQVQYIETRIGRKELEEFCIVNVPTELNRFQLGKCSITSKATSFALWTAVQALSVDLLTQGADAALGQLIEPWFDTTLIRPDALYMAGLYMVRNGANNKLIYIGESSDIAKRYSTHSDTTYFSALRRHIGTEMLGFELKKINNRARYFSESEDVKVTDILRTSRLAYLPMAFGRVELEESLIRKHHPLLNRKDNPK